MKLLRIAIIHPTLSTLGGAEKTIFHLTKHLITKGHHVTIISHDISKKTKSMFLEIGAQINTINIPFLTLNDALPLNITLMAKRLKPLLKKFDAINVHNFPATLWCAIAMNFDKKNAPPICWFCHEPYRTLYRHQLNERHETLTIGINSPSLYKQSKYHSELTPNEKKVIALDKRTPNILSSTLTNSAYTAKKVSEIYTIKPIVCHVGIPFDAIDNLPKPSFKNNHHFGTVARLEIAKNIPSILLAVRKLLDRKPELQKSLIFSIIGTGSLEHDIQSVIRKLNLTPYIRLHGIVTDEALYTLMAQWKCCCFLPFQEPLGLIPLEAGAIGIPSIASNEGGPKETVRQSKTGLLVNPLNIDEISDAIDLLLTQDDICEAMGHAAKDFVRNNFNFQQTAEKIESELVRITHSQSLGDS